MNPHKRVSRELKKLVKEFGPALVYPAAVEHCADYVVAQGLGLTKFDRKTRADEDSILFHARKIGLRTCLERIALCDPYQLIFDIIERCGTDALWRLRQILESRIVPDDLLPQRIVVERDGKVLLVDRGSVVEVKPERDGEEAVE